jgi:hypothetical protein
VHGRSALVEGRDHQARPHSGRSLCRPASRALGQPLARARPGGPHHTGASLAPASPAVSQGAPTRPRAALAKRASHRRSPAPPRESPPGHHPTVQPRPGGCHRSSMAERWPGFGGHPDAPHADSLLEHALRPATSSRVSQRACAGGGLPAHARPRGVSRGLRSACGTGGGRERLRPHNDRAGHGRQSLALHCRPEPNAPRQLGSALALAPSLATGGPYRQVLPSSSQAHVADHASGDEGQQRHAHGRARPPHRGYLRHVGKGAWGCSALRHRPEGRRTSLAGHALRATARQRVPG